MRALNRKHWLGFSVVVIGAILVAATSATKEPEGIYISHVVKNSVEKYLVNMSTSEGQIVATPHRLDNVMVSTLVPRNEGMQLFVAETFDDKVLPGEVARIAGVAVIEVPWGTDFHAHVGNHHIYARPVGFEAQTKPKTKSNKNIISVSVNKESRSAIPQIDREYIEAKLRQLSGADPFVIDGETHTISERGGSAGRALARKWLKQEFESLGYATSEHDFGDGINFIAERQGADTSRYLIVSAHYDSVHNAGADDDAGGMIVALAVANALQGLDLQYNLRILGFDLEESGLVGSRYYARHLNESGDLDGLVGVVQLEMPGYDEDGDGEMHIIDCNENSSADLTAVFEGVLSAEPDLNLVKRAACTNRSDHASFWTYDRPAIVMSQNFFGGDSNPCYHRSCDTVDRMDFEYMRRITQMIAYGVGNMIVVE